MLKALGFCIKVILFSILVLVLGNWVQWNGRTLSDQVRLSMAHTEDTNFIETVHGWAERITHDARKGHLKKPDYASPVSEEISSSERQKLKALIRELNSSHKKN
jgi:hypothetical protein